jgi:hypothetical protein
VRISARIPPEASERMAALIATTSDDPGPGEDAGGPETFADIKADPGNVSLKTTRQEIAKLTAIRAAGLPGDLFDGIAPKVLAAWRARAAAEAPSHLRAHPEEIRLTLLAALVHCRQREITDTLADLLIATVHRINARAEKKVTGELIADLNRVSGKESILFGITAAAVEAPDGLVRDVIYPAAGGEQTLIDLLREYKAKGSSFRRHKQRVLKASYTNHYRHGLVELLQALDFHFANTAHRPVIEALELIERTAARPPARSSTTAWVSRCRSPASSRPAFRSCCTAPTNAAASGSCAPCTSAGCSRPCGTSCGARRSGSPVLTGGATPMRTCPPTSRPAGPRTTPRRASRWTQPGSPATCARRCTSSSPRSTTPCPAWTGCRSPGARAGRSPSRPSTPLPNRATCADSRPRSRAAGAPCRCWTC